MATPSTSQAGHPPLSGSTLVLGTLALSLATFMNVLDTSIANVALPAIAGDLGVAPSQGTWVITSFAVANAIAVPLTGWLTQRLGAVRLFVTSILLFTLFSWLCGFATSLPMLVVFRIAQGAVAGPMIPLSQTLLLASYPAAKSGMALAMWAMTTLVAPVVGPLLGGWITDNMSWPWIFYINVPVGLVAAFATWIIYRKRDTPTRKLPIDGIGLALLTLWVGSLQVVLDRGKELDWFESPEILSLTLIAALGFIVFLIWELTERHPVVELRLFARRNFAIGTITLAIAYGLFFGNVVLLPLWLQQYMGYTATSAGMALAPVGILAIILSPIIGRIVSKTDPRILVTISFLGFTLVLWMRSFFTPQTDLGTILVPTVLQGAALAFFFIPLATISYSGLTHDRIPAAAGLSNFFRITAGAFGTSLATTQWADRAALHHAHLTEAIARGNFPFDTTLATLRAAGLSESQALAQIDRLIDVQAYTMAADDVFYGSALLFVVMVALIWFTHPEQVAARRAARAASTSGGKVVSQV